MTLRLVAYTQIKQYNKNNNSFENISQTHNV